MEISLENLYVDTGAWVKKNNQGFFETKVREATQQRV